MKHEFTGKRIGLPFIGAGLAGGDWDVIEDIINDELEGEDVTVVIWEGSREQWQLDLLEESDVLNKTVIMETWTESESGFGQRPDGVSLHLTRDDYDAYVKDFWHGKGGGAPAIYTREDGNTTVVNVGQKLYNEIKNTKNGLRLWESPSRLVSEGRVKTI